MPIYFTLSIYRVLLSGGVRAEHSKPYSKRGALLYCVALREISGIGDYAANGDSFQNCSLTRLGLSAFCQNEKERTHAQTVILCSLSYMWCRCREALCAAFRCSAFKTARRPDVCRLRALEEEMNS